MRDFIYRAAPYAFGTSLFFWLVGGPFHITWLLTFAAWIGMIISFIWCWNVVLDPSLSRKDRVLMNLVPLIWFISSWLYLYGVIHVP